MSLYAHGIVRILTDPDARYFESGSSVVKFLGGLSEGKDKNGNYINNSIEVEAWNQSGEVITNYCKKGSSVMATGNIRQEEWEDRETGAKRRKHVFKVNRFELMPRSDDSGSPAPAPAAAAAPSPLAAPYPSELVEPDDIPF